MHEDKQEVNQSASGVLRTSGYGEEKKNCVGFVKMHGGEANRVITHRTHMSNHAELMSRTLCTVQCTTPTVRQLFQRSAKTRSALILNGYRLDPCMHIQIISRALHYSSFTKINIHTHTHIQLASSNTRCRILHTCM